MTIVKRREDLQSFLLGRFRPVTSLEMFVDTHFEDLSPKIRWTGNLETQAHDFIERLIGSRRLAELWPILKQDFAPYASEIDALEQAWRELSTTPTATRPAAPNLALQFYRGTRTNTVANAAVLLTDLFAGTALRARTDHKGISRFVHDGDTPATYFPEVVLGEGTTARRAGLGHIRVEELPYDDAIELPDDRNKAWVSLDAGLESTGPASADPTVVFDSTQLDRTLVTRARDVLGDAAAIARHLPWGTPAAEVVLARDSYALGFSPTLKLARWVAYRVQLSPRPRVSSSRWTQQFRPDPLLPVEQQTPSAAYRGSGYDRGGLVRRIEVPSDEHAFYLSVTAPQSPAVNQAAWAAIERLSSSAAETDPVWVIAGPVFLPARAGSSEVLLLRDRFLIPSHFFRILVRGRGRGAHELQAFLVPNEVTLKADPQLYETSIDRIQESTGLVFFADGAPAFAPWR